MVVDKVGDSSKNESESRIARIASLYKNKALANSAK